MLKNIIRSQISKRFCHIHSKTNIQENVPKNKIFEDLITKQNKTLDEINSSLWEMSRDINTIKIWGLLFGFLIALKPTSR